MKDGCSCSINIDVSRRFRTISFICACMVVMIHASVFPPEGTFSWWVAFVVGANGLCRVAVPYFFLIAGFFLFGREWREDWYGSAVRSRVRSLVVPFYAWMVVTVLVMCVVSMGIRLLKYDYQGVAMLMPEASVSYVLSVLGINPVCDIGPLWFLRTLFVFVLLSPVLLKVINSRFRIVLLCGLLFFVIFLRLGYVCNDGLRICFSFFLPPEGMLYFMLGVMLRFGRIPAAKKMWQVVFLASAIVLLVLKGVFLSAKSPRCACFADMLMVPSMMGALWIAAGRLSFSSAVSSLSFPIYLLHGFILLIFTSVYALVGLSEYAMSSICAMAVKFTATLFGSIFIADFLRKNFPRVAKIMFGGRT